MSKEPSKQEEDNKAVKDIVINYIQKLMICDIPAWFGKGNRFGMLAMVPRSLQQCRCLAYCLHKSHINTG